MLYLARRNGKEILRDPMNLLFGLGFPVALMLLFSAIQANVPVALFEIASVGPGLAVFGLSFISLFSGMLIAKDRSSSFLMRLYASPLRPVDFIMAYVLPMFPLALGQICLTLMAAILLGLPMGLNLLLLIVVMIPVTVLFIGIGLLAGSMLSDKAVGGVCGALLTNLSAWLSGTWFDVGLVGGWFESMAYALPFAHAVDAARAAVSGDYAAIMPHLLWVSAYALVIMALAITVFSRSMQSES